MLRAASLCVPMMVAIASEDAAWLWRDRAWNFDWDERQTAQDDNALFPGFGRHMRPVAPGWWGALEADVMGSGSARAAYAPGLAPTYDGGRGRIEADKHVAIPHAFLSLRPEVLFALDGERQPVPNGDARQIWTGSDPDHRYAPVSAVIRGTLGVWGAGHVLAASNEPIQWGEGVFGGAVLGRMWRGFPHALIAPLEPWLIGTSDIAVDYQLIGGVLDDARPTPDDPWIAAYRVATRWRWVSLSFALAAQAGGGTGTDGAELLSPAADEDPQDADGNRMMSIGLRLMPGTVALYGEYAVEDSGDADRPALHPHGAAWLAGLDWLDVTGQQEWRLCLEWSRAESPVHYNPTWQWEYRNLSLGVPEGGNSAAARVLIQRRFAGDGAATLILGWEQRGWRNASDDNAVGTQPAGLQQPGGPLFAPTDWQTWSATLHLEFEAARASALLIDLAAFYDTGRGFVDGEDHGDGAAGIGWRTWW